MGNVLVVDKIQARKTPCSREHISRGQRTIAIFVHPYFMAFRSILMCTMTSVRHGSRQAKSLTRRAYRHRAVDTFAAAAMLRSTLPKVCLSVSLRLHLVCMLHENLLSSLSAALSTSLAFVYLRKVRILYVKIRQIYIDRYSEVLPIVAVCFKVCPSITAGKVFP